MRVNVLHKMDRPLTDAQIAAIYDLAEKMKVGICLHGDTPSPGSVPSNSHTCCPWSGSRLTPVTDRPTFYHGTRRGFRGAGGLLVPRAEHGGKPTGAPVNPGYEPRPDAVEYVYVTTDLDLAWAYAWAAVGRGKPKVLIVNPLGPVEHDPEHSIHMPAYRCEAAVIKKVLTEPAIGELEAMSGWAIGIEP